MRYSHLSILRLTPSIAGGHLRCQKQGKSHWWWYKPRISQLLQANLPLKKEKCSVKQSCQCWTHSAIQLFWSYLVIYGVYHHCKTFKQCWNSFRTGPISRGVLLSWVERSNVRLKKFSNEGEASPDQILHSANCWFSLNHKSQTFKQSTIEHFR